MVSKGIYKQEYTYICIYVPCKYYKLKYDYVYKGIYSIHMITSMLLCIV